MPRGSLAYHEAQKKGYTTISTTTCGEPAEGWELRVRPPLMDWQLRLVQGWADDTWDEELGNYSKDKYKAMLEESFPDHDVEEV